MAGRVWPVCVRSSLAGYGLVWLGMAGKVRFSKAWYVLVRSCSVRQACSGLAGFFVAGRVWFVWVLLGKSSFGVAGYCMAG